MDDAAHEEGYVGTITLAVGGAEFAVDAILRGYFEPLDGRYHWYGRVAVDQRLTEIVSGRTAVEVRTSEGTAHGELGDVDTWGRFRVAGKGRPPFRFATSLADLETGADIQGSMSV